MALIVIAQNLLKGKLERPDGTADYDVEVSVNRVRYIWTGKIVGHVRASGAAALLRKIVEEMERDSDT